MTSIKIIEAQEKHAKAICDFLEALAAERLDTTFRRDAAPTEEEERSFIREVNANDKAVLFLALKMDKVVGLLNFRGHPKPQMSHGGEFGVSVAKAYRGQGIAKQLIKTLLAWADRKALKRIELRVFSNNARAIRLYEHLGFIKEGCQKDAVRINQSFVDIFLMTRFL